MKIVLHLLIAAVFLAGCSFKKNSDSHQQVREAGNMVISLFHSVSEESIKDIEIKLKDFTASDLNSLNIEGFSLMDVALKRGNPIIVQMLLEYGISPFSKNSKSGVKTYQRIRSLHHTVGDTLSYWITSEFFEVLQKEEAPSKKLDQLRSMGMNCDDILNIHAAFSTKTSAIPISEMVLPIATLPVCQNELNLKKHSFWVKSALISLAKNRSVDLHFLSFLQTLKGFQGYTIEIDTKTETLEMTPATLINILGMTSFFRDNQIDAVKVSKISEYFDKDTKNAVFKLDKTTPILARNTYFINSPEGNEEVIKEIMNGLSDFELSTSKDCYLNCNQDLKALDGIRL